MPHDRSHALVLGLALLVAAPAHAQQFATIPAPAARETAVPQLAAPEIATDTLPVWERTLYKTLTYQAAANLSDLALYGVLLGGTAVAGAGFFAVNAVSAASLYYGFEYAWQAFGPPPEEKTNQTIAQKTVLFRVLNSSRNFALGYGFGGSVTVAAGFVAANFVTDTLIFVTNEYAWDVFRPGAPARSQITPSSLAVIRGRP